MHMDIDFERRLIAQCAPTLAGLKAGSLLVWNNVRTGDLPLVIDQWNNLLNKKGIYIELLKLCKGRCLLYVYRRDQLKKLIAKNEIREFLFRYGYENSDDAERNLNRLCQRVSDAKEFPHEIGVFLGYPLHNVVGFIQNNGKNACYCGCWKVYADKEEAIRVFTRIKKCCDTYRALFEKGYPLTKLEVA